MVQGDPSTRLKMADVVREFALIRQKLSNSQLRSRLARRDEFFIAASWRQCTHLLRTAHYVFLGIPPISDTDSFELRRAKTEPEKYVLQG
jgi:hypothetical protein